MKLPTLASLAEAFLTYHQALGHAPGTVQHHADTIKLFRRFLAATDRPDEATSLTPPVLTAWAAWLRDTKVPKQTARDTAW